MKNTLNLMCAHRIHVFFRQTRGYVEVDDVDVIVGEVDDDVMGVNVKVNHPRCVYIRESFHYKIILMICSLMIFSVRKL